METTSAMDTVRDLIVELKLPGVEADRIGGAAELRELGITSLNLLILLARLQEKTGMPFSGLSRSVADIRTVDDLVALVDASQPAA